MISLLNHSADRSIPPIRVAYPNIFYYFIQMVAAQYSGYYYIAKLFITYQLYNHGQSDKLPYFSLLKIRNSKGAYLEGLLRGLVSENTNYLAHSPYSINVTLSITSGPQPYFRQVLDFKLVNFMANLKKRVAKKAQG